MSDPSRSGTSGLTALSEGLSIAWAVMLGNKVRSLLTILGVAIGVSVVVAIGALLTGLRGSILEAFEAAGPTNFVVSRFDLSAITVSFNGDPRALWEGRPQLEPEDARALQRLETIRDATYDLNQFAVRVESEGTSVPEAFASAYSVGWPAYTPGDFVAGRNFTDADVRQSRPVVVLSPGLAEELFGSLDPIGRSVKVSNPRRGSQEHFTVIGVFKPTDNIFSGFLDRWAIFPWSSAHRRLGRSKFEAQLLLVPEDSVSIERAQDDVIASFRARRGLRPGDDNNFDLLQSSQILDTFDQLTGVFFLVILLLASAGLLVGGVGVIGIMLISVTERTREIGIRKAVGATRREILWQFLVEATLLTALGAMTGLLLGWLLAEGVARATPLPADIPAWSVAAALGMAVMTGMLFGLLPAYRASRLEPVAALRHE